MTDSGSVDAGSGVHRADIGDFPLASGMVLPDVRIAYVTFGQLADDGRNTVLVTHGFSSGPSMLMPRHGTAEGSWAAMVGPGKPLDTHRFFIVCSNMLGSAYGSTGPSSVDPATGEPYGPDFPDITVADMVEAQRRLLRQLGVVHLRAVVGPSYGGIQAQQWALDFPDMVDAIGVVVSGPRFPASSSVESLLSTLRQDPNWNGGHYHRHGGVHGTLKAMRLRTLRNYNLDTLLRDKYRDEARVQAELEAAAQEWAAQFDANSLVTLMKAAVRFDVADRYPEIRAQVLYVISNTDPLFPPDAANVARLDRLPRGRDQYRYLEIESRYGHLASGVDHAKWSDSLANLLRAKSS